MLTKGDDHPSAEPSTSGEAGRRLRGQRILITGAGRGLGAVLRGLWLMRVARFWALAETGT